MTSSHLARLTGAHLLKAEKQGRHRDHRLANAEVARTMEGMMALAAAHAPKTKKISAGPREAAMRRARSCYDHIAGRLGVAVAGALCASGTIELEDDAGMITPHGTALFRDMGLNLAVNDKKTRRPLCRPCLDWSERRPHLAGKLVQAMCAHCLGQGWLWRQPASRALEITPVGHGALRTAFGLKWQGEMAE